MTGDDPSASRGVMARPRGARLGWRMAVLVVAAMLPIGLLSVLQTRALRSEALSRAELALMGQTVQAGGPLIELIRNAQATARTLALTMGGIERAPESCRRRMARVQATEPAFSLVAYIPTDGFMTCASTGQSFDFSSVPMFGEIISNPEPQFVVNPNGPVSGTSVLGIIHPVFGDDGAISGVVSISIPHRRLPPPASAGENGSGQVVMLVTFNLGGELLAASVETELVNNQLPADRTLAVLASGGSASFTTAAADGGLCSYSVVMLADGLFMMGSLRAQTQTGLARLASSPFVLPLLMWVSGLAVALLAAEALVTRHVRLLDRAMARFAGGDRIPERINLANAPDEVRRLGRSYEDLIGIILQDEAELENLLRQKQVLLREVHHRTGNSLQLIASMIRLHMRQDPPPELRALLVSLHDRVMLLATVHLGLYQTADQPDVSIDGLLGRVLHQMKTLAQGEGRNVEVSTDFDRLRLTPDQAVPVALLVAELLSGLRDPGEAGAERAEVSVALRQVGPSDLELSVGSTARVGPGTTGTGWAGYGQIAGQLVRGFTEQLGGTATTEEVAGRSVFRLVFPIRETGVSI